MRVGIGHDTHRLVEGRPLILGGVRIDHPRGSARPFRRRCRPARRGRRLARRGRHWATSASISPTPTRSGKGLDRRPAARRGGRARSPGQAGPSATATWSSTPRSRSSPRTSRHPGQPRRLLRVETSAVNVKAKTGEHVGPIGRGEAIACEAVVLLIRQD